MQKSSCSDRKIHENVENENKFHQNSGLKCRSFIDVKKESWYIMVSVVTDKLDKKQVGVINMYQEEFNRWLAADLEDPDLKPELSRIEGNDDEIKERFAVALKFGTAGLRGVLEPERTA